MIFCTGGKKKKAYLSERSRIENHENKRKKGDIQKKINVKDLYLWNLYLGRYLIKL